MTYKFSLKIERSEQNFQVILEASGGHPLDFSVLNVPLVLRERNGVTYYHLAFENSTGITGIEYGNMYDKKTKQRKLLSELELAVQEKLRQGFDKARFPFRRKQEIETDYGFAKCSNAAPPPEAYKSVRCSEIEHPPKEYLEDWILLDDEFDE